MLLGKQSIMSLALNVKKEVAHMFIHLYGFSMHQILKMKLSEFIEKTKKAQLRDYLNYLKLFELVKTSMLTLKPDGNTARMNLASPIINILLRRQLF